MAEEWGGIRLSRRGGRRGRGGIETRQLHSSPPCRTWSWRVIAVRKEATGARCVGEFERSASHAGCRRVDSGATSLCAPPNPTMHRDRHPRLGARSQWYACKNMHKVDLEASLGGRKPARVLGRESTGASASHANFAQTRYTTLSIAMQKHQEYRKHLR